MTAPLNRLVDLIREVAEDRVIADFRGLHRSKRGIRLQIIDLV